jgi:hypothetical protein
MKKIEPRFLTRETILSALDRKYEDVPVPEWGPGAMVRVQSLSAQERDNWEESNRTKPDSEGRMDTIFENMRARLVALTVVNGEGNPLFSKGDVAEIGKKNAAPIDRIFEVACRLSGIGRNDVKEMVKNSGAGQGAGSS